MFHQERTSLSSDALSSFVFTRHRMKNRIVHINDRHVNTRKRFANNAVHTTKYSLLSFLPVFLFHQFRRPANIFFLFIMCIEQFKDFTPFNDSSTIIPFAIIFGFSALKEIFEDIKRRSSDSDINNRKVLVFQNGKFVQKKCRDIVVGDIIKVLNNKSFPADLIILASSEPEGMAYLETANIDGESNLKIRVPNIRTTHLIDDESIAEFQGTITCEPPNERIYHFEGSLDTGSTCISLEHNNMLLRGATLKNTQWVVGVVVYSGHESKIMMNANETPIKITKMDRKTDKQFFYIAIGLICLTTLCTLGRFYSLFRSDGVHWYLFEETVIEKITLKPWNYYDFLKTFLGFVMLFNTLIPISLSVTLEFIRLILGFLVNYDIEMYDEESDTPATARSSNLMEELGQVECILTDKTGTLTRNEMILKHIVIEGETFLDCNHPNCNLTSAPKTDKIDLFLIMLASCHTVMIDRTNPDDPVYQGSSPDELAMVSTADRIGYSFKSRSSGTITIKINDQDVQIDVFAVIEFTSARKRMSIVALLPDGNYYLFTKGADNVIFDRLSSVHNDSLSSESQVFKESVKALEHFASLGLRTLCFAYRKLDKDFALEWLDNWTDALNTVTDRQVVVDAVANDIETDLYFIGATGVEDRLQDKVPETIRTLMKANIKIWMLTGDRYETALSTAFLSSLIDDSTVQLHLLVDNENVIIESLKNFISIINSSSKGSKFALVLNGPVCEIILSPVFLKTDGKQLLIAVIGKCSTLLCCRLSPLQKALITVFAKEELKFVTLAIGDGGNDVNMIQSANVGVGISGKEGLQASRSADFAIAQFRFLVKLVLVHGSWTLHRLSRVVMYSIYKNFVLVFAQIWFCFFNQFSGQSLFQVWMLVNWNLVFTCWPPTVIGLTDQYVLAADLVENPQLYEFGQKNRFYDSKSFWMSAINAIGHSFMIFFTVYLLCKDGGFVTQDGYVSTLLMHGAMIFAIVLNVVCMKIALFSNFFTLFLAVSVIFSASLWYFFTIYSQSLFKDFSATIATMQAFKMPVFWAILFLVPVIVTTRDFLWKFYQRQFCPRPYHIIQELKLAESTIERKVSGGRESPSLVFVGMSRKPRKSRGYSFSQSYGQSRILQAYGQSPKLSTFRKTSI